MHILYVSVILYYNMYLLNTHAPTNICLVSSVVYSVHIRMVKFWIKKFEYYAKGEKKISKQNASF